MGWPLGLASTLYPNKEFYLDYLYRMRLNNGISFANGDRLYPVSHGQHWPSQFVSKPSLTLKLQSPIPCNKWRRATSKTSDSKLGKGSTSSEPVVEGRLSGFNHHDTYTFKGLKYQLFTLGESERLWLTSDSTATKQLCAAAALHKFQIRPLPHSSCRNPRKVFTETPRKQSVSC